MWQSQLATNCNGDKRLMNWERIIQYVKFITLNGLTNHWNLKIITVFLVWLKKILLCKLKQITGCLINHFSKKQISKNRVNGFEQFCVRRRKIFQSCRTRKSMYLIHSKHYIYFITVHPTLVSINDYREDISAKSNLLQICRVGNTSPGLDCRKSVLDVS